MWNQYPQYGVGLRDQAASAGEDCKLSPKLLSPALMSARWTPLRCGRLHCSTMGVAPVRVSSPTSPHSSTWIECRSPKAKVVSSNLTEGAMKTYGKAYGEVVVFSDGTTVVKWNDQTQGCPVTIFPPG